MTQEEDEFERAEQIKSQNRYQRARSVLHDALHGLVGSGSLKDRLNNAYLFISMLNEKNFPDDLLPQFAEVKRTMENLGAGMAVSEGEANTASSGVLSPLR